VSLKVVCNEAKWIFLIFASKKILKKEIVKSAMMELYCYPNFQKNFSALGLQHSLSMLKLGFHGISVLPFGFLQPHFYHFFKNL
jgi:hypothetical protein